VNLEEIKKVKDFSKSSKSEFSPWNNWEESMFQKTAIRKALKTVSLDFGNTLIQNAYSQTDTDIDFTPRQSTTQIKVQKDVLDVEVVEQGQEISLKDLE